MAKIPMPKQGDFLVNNKIRLEIGGKRKTGKQLQGLKDAYIVKDDILYPTGNSFPLWIIRMLY
jgi:hypothetical protein